ncbi:6-bladed beta-propeller [candidate division KSB1 bacterium]
MKSKIIAKMYMKGVFHLKPAITLMLLIPIACSPAENDTYTVEEIGGVKYVHNHSAVWGDEPGVQLEFVQRIGVMEGEDSNYMLFNPNNVVVDEIGDIYVLDSGNYRIQVYTSEGIYKRTIGSYGQGPGEMSHWPHAFDIYNSILYLAHNNRLIHKFSTDGKDLGTVISPEIYIPYIRVLSSGNILTKSWLGYFGISSYEPEEICLFSVFSPEDGQLLRKIGDPIRFESAHETRTVNGISAEIGRDDNIYAVFELRNRLDRYSAEGELIFSSDRPLNYDVLEKPEWIDTRGRKVPRVPGFTTVSKGIAIDNRDRIWVLTANRILTDDELTRMRASMDRAGGNPEDSKNIYDFHIFDPEGVFLGPIPLPVSWLECKMRIFGDRLFLIEREYETCVHEYRIIDK